MFQLHDLRKSRVWQEAHETGIEKGRAEGIQKGRAEGMEKGKTEARREVVQRLAAKGKSLKEIAELLELPLSQVRRLAHR